ncbi:MAG: hypothetical protein KKA73_21985, partial [Chloroflexi bacterium]|nr:hypothetical protein [Chloroflexota bacterium]
MLPPPQTPIVRTVGLVGCSARKLSTPAPARDLYQGRIFRAALPYAEHHHDATLILSAKYGLV